MSSFFNRLSKIDNRTKYGVYGWIRQAEIELKLCHIPLVISSICILYAHDDEIFEIIEKGVKSYNHGKCIKIGNKIGLTKFQWQHAFGKIVIPSIDDGIYEWEMNINTSDITGRYVVGITSLDPILTEDEGVNIWYRNGVHYLYYGCGSSIFKGNSK